MEPLKKKKKHAFHYKSLQYYIDIVRHRVCKDLRFYIPWHFRPVKFPVSTQKALFCHRGHISGSTV